MKRTKLKNRSAKTASLYRDQRVPLVIRLLEERPWCERCSHPDGHMIYTVRSTVIHEKRLRSAGGSITDEGNCVALCQECHQWCHDNPKKAQEEGFLERRFNG